ncbi:MAG: hypothetical protein ACSHX4_10495 [Opitutaceae bacterium]
MPGVVLQMQNYAGHHARILYAKMAAPCVAYKAKHGGGGGSRTGLKIS